MPYFLQKRDDEWCVMKGTKESPEGTEKCHPTREAAMAHMRALYVHVEDAGKANVASENVTANLIHGSGGILSPMRGGDGDALCACSKCDHQAKKVGDTPCAERKCPECGSPMQEKEVSKVSEEVSKADWDTAYVNDLPDSAFLYVESGEKEDGKTVPRTKRHLPYKSSTGEVDLPHLRNALSRLGQSGTGEGWLTPALRKSLVTKAQKILAQHSKSRLSVYKSLDGTWRWLSVSNVAVEDKVGEVVSEKAYDDAIAYARANGAFGELDLVHVNGTDVGDCDLQVRLGDQLIEGGPWYTDKRAVTVREKVSENPDYWGVSIKFRYDPDQFDGRVYQGGIQIPKRTILPRQMAASHGTAIAVTGGETMKSLDDETRKALSDLGMSDEAIEALAEAQKSVEEEPNVVTKEDEHDTPPATETKAGFSLGSFLSDIRDTVRETVKGLSVKDELPEPAPEETPEVEKETEPVAEDTETATDSDVVVKALQEFGVQVSKGVAEVLATELAPLKTALAESHERLSEVEKRLVEAEKDVESKVLDRLKELPPVVTAAPSQVAATVDPAEPGTLSTETKSALAGLMTDIFSEVEKKVSSGQYKL
jgi:hypothetical protein